ncbi:RTA1 like protein-domain-containing protein [Daldinia caldariorum]|uniref:RTA1 like protein-domain-containing protein n=1 Tax=Daldinia caldariorum TaxID=326644 RepID=UPI0020089231|nr:RTA1 like protein-domain-containing protein [Daldinia caldariorum]KAI1465916.1 RTA1 like protein-domain-containing protein [Daldinia caldariorum]
MANSTDCVSSRCSRVFLTYEPSLAGNAVFLALFAILLPVAFALGIKYKSTVFSTALMTGLALEVVGYIGRILLHNTPADRSGFILFLIGTTVGPTFICGSIFFIIPRIITVYGEELRSWRPIWYSFLLQGLATLSFVLELAGGLVSTIQDDQGRVDIGAHVLAAGLAIQLVTLVIVLGHAILCAIAIHTRHHMLDIKFAGIYNSGSFKAFLFAFAFAIALLILRTAYRTIMAAEGYDSSIAQSETLLLVLDGLMVLLAILALLVFFPGRILRDSNAASTDTGGSLQFAAIDPR